MFHLLIRSFYQSPLSLSLSLALPTSIVFRLVRPFFYHIHGLLNGSIITLAHFDPPPFGPLPFYTWQVFIFVSPHPSHSKLAFFSLSLLPLFFFFRASFDISLSFFCDE